MNPASVPPPRDGRPMMRCAAWHLAAPDATMAYNTLQQSAVCHDLNVWPSMPMFVIKGGVAKTVGTWYWCDGVWIGHAWTARATEWLA